MTLALSVSCRVQESMGTTGRGMVVSGSVLRTAGFYGSAALSFLLLAASARAQSPAVAAPSPPPAQASPQPASGFVSPYEILRTARAAGFDPLAPPLRDGSIYVLRATDFRGILMRVVLDARTGAIRDVTRIVPANSDSYGMMPPPYGTPPYAAPPYGPPPYAPPPDDASAKYDAPAPQVPPADYGAPTELTRPAAPPARTHPTAIARPLSPPLPRPRPAALTPPNSEKTGTAKGPSVNAHSANAQAHAGANADTIGPNVGTTPAPSAAPGKTPPLAPFND